MKSDLWSFCQSIHPRYIDVSINSSIYYLKPVNPLSDGADQLVNAMFVVKGWASSTDNAVREAVEDLNTAKSSPFQMYQVDIGSSLSVSYWELLLGD